MVHGLFFYYLKKMNEPTHISLIIESMDIFAKEPKLLTFKRLRRKKSRCATNTTAKTKFLNAFTTRAKL